MTKDPRLCGAINHPWEVILIQVDQDGKRRVILQCPRCGKERTDRRTPTGRALVGRTYTDGDVYGAYLEKTRDSKDRRADAWDAICSKATPKLSVVHGRRRKAG